MQWRKLLSVITWVGGWPSIFLFIYGIPGHIEDSSQWYRLAKAVSNWPIFIVSIGLVASGPVLWTHHWWWPLLSKRKSQSPSATSHDPRQKFEQLYPLIIREAERHNPNSLRNRFGYRGPESIKSSTQSDINYIKLRTELNRLNIPFPSDSVEDVVMYRYLVNLAALSQSANLEGARHFYVEL